METRAQKREKEEWEKKWAERQERMKTRDAEIEDETRRRRLWAEIRDKEDREKVSQYYKDLHEHRRLMYAKQDEEEWKRWRKMSLKEKCDDCAPCLFFSPLNPLSWLLMISLGRVGNHETPPALYNVRHPDTATTLTNPPKRPAHALDIISQKLRKADLDQTQLESLVDLENMTDAEKTRILKVCEACAEVIKLGIEHDEFCGPPFEYCALLK